MDLGLRGKKAVVCGGSRGIGFAIAQKLAFEGTDVALLARHPIDLKKAAHSIQKSSGRKVMVYPIDLAQTRRIPALMKRIQKEMGAIDILVNNAGGPPPGGLFDIKDSDWQKTFDQNLRSVIVMSQFVIPEMKKRRFGRILNVASQLVKEPSPRMILSNTLRSGVVSFAKTISFELASFGITVNTLCPGAILTDRLNSLMTLRAKREKRTLAEVVRDVESSIPIKRIGRPEEFASLAVFLASEKASYITGTLIAVDGGMTKSLM